MPSIPVVMIGNEIAKYLRVDESSIYWLYKADKILGYKVGRSWRFKKNKIDERLVQSHIIIKEENKKPLVKKHKYQRFFLCRKIHKS